MPRGNQALTTMMAVSVVLSMALVGAVGIVAADQHRDGNYGNGEETRSASNEDEPQWPGNYTLDLDDHSPGLENGNANHYSYGFSENHTIHYIEIRSPDFNFGDCSSANARAFGIDRGNNDSGTHTDESLLDAYQDSWYEDDRITLEFYKEPGELTGKPRNVTVYDEIVARQEGCIDNPPDPGWYRVFGKINGSTTNDTETDFANVAYTNWIYICDCDNRQQAENQLGPAPAETEEAYSESGEGPSGGGGDGDGDGTDTPTPTVTQTPTPGDGDGTDTPTPTTTQTGTDTETVTTTTGGTTETTAGGDDGGDQSTRTEENQPGFGAVIALVALLAIAAVAQRRR